jgi:mannosyltransferase OCH1-like enzyme
MFNQYFKDIVNSKNIESQRLFTMKSLHKKSLIEKLLKTAYPLKENYNPIVPLNIFQTWHTKKLPPLMKNAVNKIKINHPRFTHHLFDDNDCYEFIKNNFDSQIVDAFEKLIPGAYKADLWRYCVLYKLGGIYLDIKYEPVNNFELICLTEQEHWVLDMDGEGIYNALIVSKPGNPILLRAINEIVNNVNIKFYGASALSPTGPLLLSKYFTKEEKKSFKLRHDVSMTFDNRFIFFNGYIILKQYNGYLNEHGCNKKTLHYSELWTKKHIYSL